MRAPRSWFGAPAVVDPVACDGVCALPGSPYALVYGTGQEPRLWRAGAALPRRCAELVAHRATLLPSGQSGVPALLEVTGRDGTGRVRTRVSAPPDGCPGPWTAPAHAPAGMGALGLAQVTGRWVLLVGVARGTCAMWDPGTAELRALPEATAHTRPLLRTLVAGPPQRPLAVVATSAWQWEDDDEGGYTRELFYAVVYDLTTAEIAFRIDGLNVDALCAVGQTPQGWLIAAATEPLHTIRFFDALTGIAQETAIRHGDDLTALAVGSHRPGGHPVLVTGTEEGQVRAWDVRDGRARGAWQVDDYVNDLAVHPDMGLLVATDSGLRVLPPAP